MKIRTEAFKIEKLRPKLEKQEPSQSCLKYPVSPCGCVQISFDHFQAQLSTRAALHTMQFQEMLKCTAHGWTPSDQEEKLRIPPGSLPVNSTTCFVSGMCLKHTASVNTSSANLLLGTLLSSMQNHCGSL